MLFASGVKMCRSVCVLVPVLAVLALVVPMSRACPRTCNCYQANEVHCTFRSLLAIPAGLPERTLRINLGFNSISRIPDNSLAGLKRAELMMLHGNDLHHIPDEAFRDMKSLQVLKLSYNKLREISSSMTFSGLTSLLRLHLDHNLLQHIHPQALLQLPSLRLLRLQGNRLHQLHPHSLCTLSLLNTYYYSTLRHLDLSNNSLTTLPKEMLATAPLLETLILHENPWSCDCRLSWFLSWSGAHTGLMKCPRGPNCPMCASPNVLQGQGLLQQSDLSCASPVISAPGRDPPSEADLVELQQIETFRDPLGSAFLGLSDQQGNRVDLSCNVTHSTKSPDISPPPDLSLSSSDPLALAVSLSLECPVERGSYEELWRILAYYSETAVRLEREIMLSKAPALAYRYRQTVETEGYYHTGVRASVKANPHWLLQPAISIQLNRAQSSGHRVNLILMTRVSTRPDPISNPLPFSSSSRTSSPSPRPWVLISTNYTTPAMAALTGRRVDLFCPVLSSGNPTLQWILPDGSKLISPSGSPDGRIQTSASGLILQRVELSDAGLYHCVAQAGSDVDILPLHLVVEESSCSPAGAQAGPSFTGFIGEAFSLPCNSSGTPTPEISWVLPDGNIVQRGVAVSRGLIIQSNGSLSLIRPSPRDAGQYRCLAVNQYGADSLSMHLDLNPRSAPPFRNSFPRGPQSAAGRSTRIRASLLRENIVEEGSGDQEEEENKIPPANRRYTRPRQPLFNQRFPIGHPRRRGPMRGGSQRRGGSSLSNFEQRRNRFDNRQRGASAKQKIDPQKWADLLAKIRQRTAQNNTSQPTGEPSTEPVGREKNNEAGREKEGLEEEMEGSSIDDQSLKEEGLHRVHPVESELDEWTKINPGTQREIAINPDTERGTQRETYTQTDIQTDRSTEPQTDQENQSVTDMQTDTVANTPKPISGTNEIVPEPIEGDGREPKLDPTESTSSNPRLPAFLNLVPNSRPQSPWNARRRLGQRRRIINRPRGRPLTPPQPLPDPANTRSSTMTPDTMTVKMHTTITSRATVLGDRNHIRSSSSSGELTPPSPTYSSEGSSDTPFPVISSYLLHYLSTPSSSSSTTTHTDLPTHSINLPESEQVTVLHTSTHPPVSTHTSAKWTHTPGTMTLLPTHTFTDSRKSVERPPSKNSEDTESSVSSGPDVSLSSGIATATAKIAKTSSTTPVKYLSTTTITAAESAEEMIPFSSTIPKGTPTAISHKTTTAIIPTTSMTNTPNNAVTATASLPVSSTPRCSTTTHTIPTSTVTATISTITASVSTSTTVPTSTTTTMTTIPTTTTSATTSTTVLTTTTTSPPTTMITPITSSSTRPTTSTTSSTTPTTTTSTSTRGTSRERPSQGLVDPRGKPVSGLPNQSGPTPDWKNPGANSIPDSHRSRPHQPSSFLLPVSPGAPVVRSKPRIADPHIRTVSVPAEGTARLACEAQGWPQPTLTWTKVSTGTVMSAHSRVQRFDVLPNGTFVIQNVQLQDRGTYICSAHNSLGRDRMLTTLEVWSRPPRIQLANYREVTIHQGGEVRLDCRAEGVPSPLLSWVLPDRSVLPSTDSSHSRMTMHANGTLHILASLPSDRGVYRCVASNSAGAASVSVRLHVSSLPPVIHQPREERLLLTLGMPVYTHCTARGAPPPTLRWKIPDGTLVRPSQFLHGNLFVLPNGTLHIRKAGPKDSGIYECTASNAVGADKRKVRVELQGEAVGQGGEAGRAGGAGGAVAPTRQAPPPSIRHKDSTTRLPVTASNSTRLLPPSLFIPSSTSPNSLNTSHPSQTPKSSNPYHRNNGVVSLSPVSTHPPKHNMTKSSIFYPSAPVSPAVSAIDTEPPPPKKAPSSPPSPVSSLSKARILSTSPSVTVVHYGGDLFLHCMVSGNPSPTIIWRTPNRKLVDRHFSFDRRLKVYANGSLVVLAVTEKDAGDYLCIARNKVADDYRLLRVSVSTKPAKIEPKQPSNHMVSFGGSLKVDCLASGLPDPAVRWSLPDGTTVNSVLQGVDRGGRTRRLTVFDNGTLLVPAVGMGEEGEYTCVAENQGGQDTMKVKVKVMTSPPTFSDASYDIIRVRQGATAAISCRATGDPTPVVTWFSPGNRAIPRSWGSRYFSERVVVLTDGTLEVRLARSSDEGNYTCQAISTAGKRSRAVGLQVEVPNHRLAGSVWGPGVNSGAYGRGRTVITGPGSSIVKTGLNEASQQYGSTNGLTSRLGSNGAASSSTSSSKSYSRVGGSVPSPVINQGNSGFKPASKINSNVEDKVPANGVTTRHGNSAVSVGVSGAIKQGNMVITNSAVGSGVGSNGAVVRTSNTEAAGGRTGSDASSSSIANVRTSGVASNGASSSTVGERGLSKSVNTGGASSEISTSNAGASASSKAVSNSNNTAAFVKKRAVRGQTVILPCPSHGSPPPRLAWLLPGNGVLPAPYYGSRLTVHRNGSLELRGVRKSDDGTFVCVLRGDRGESRIQVELVVSETPEVAEERPAPRGPFLSQSTRSGGPPPSPDSVRSSIPPPPLSVTLHPRSQATEKPSQRGPLVASPSRSLGPPVRPGGSAEPARSNQRPVVSTRTASLVSIITGETLRLPCHAPQAPGYSQGSLTWTLPSGEVLSRGAAGGSGRYSVQEDGILTVQQASVFDRGSYSCRSTDHDSSSASVVTVPVIVIAYPPRIMTGPAPVTYTRPGVAVELPCLSIATPRPTVTWETPDRAQLRVTGQGRLYGNRYLSPQGSLIIQHPTSRDTGFYRCTAKNVIGVDTKATYLHVI